MKSLLICTLVALSACCAQPLAAEDERCQGCSSCGCARYCKRCRLTCEMKTKVTFEHEMDCEDICILAPSKCCGTRRVCDCMAFLGFYREHVQKPCGCNYSRNVRYPIKVPVEKKVPVYKCVMETVCCGCGNCCGATAATQTQADAVVKQAASEGKLPEEDQKEVIVPIAATVENVDP